MTAGLTNQQWNRLWRQTLGREQRRVVRKAAWRGQAVQELDLAAVVIEYACRFNRSPWTVVVPLIPPAGMLVVLASTYEPGLSSGYWFAVWQWVAIFVLGLPFGIFRVRMMRRTQARDQAMLDAIANIE